jgi:hypothetical protein
MNVILNLDEIWTGDEWDTTVGELLRDELKLAIRAEIKKGLRESKDFKAAIAKLQKAAMDEALQKIK